jgi:hypothetical protein
MIAQVLALGAALLVLSKTITLAAWSLGMLRASLLFLTSWPGIITAGLVVLIATTTSLGDTFKATMGDISAAINDGDIIGAARMLWGSLKVEWIAGRNFLVDLWDSLITGLAKGISWTLDTITTEWYFTLGMIESGWVSMIGGIKAAWAIFSGWLQKQWAKFKGLFDSDFDVQAEIRRIDQTTGDMVGEQKAKVAQKWAGAGADHAQRKASRDANYASLDASLVQAMEGRAAELAKAEDALAKAVSTSRQKRTQQIADGEFPQYQPEPGSTAPLRTSDLAAADMPAIAAAGSVSGAFDVGALLSLQAGDANDLEKRTAEASEKTARNTEAMLAALREGGYA